LRDPGGATRTVVGVGVRFHQDRWLITLDKVESMEEANSLRGVDLCLRRAELPEVAALLGDQRRRDADHQGQKRQLPAAGTLSVGSHGSNRYGAPA
jgi:hypothetical protein